MLTYTATDSSSNEVSRVFEVTINPPVTFDDPPGDLVLAQNFDVGSALNARPALPLASGGTGTLTYALTGPNGTDLTEVSGLAFDPVTRLLSGSVSTTGETVLTYTATDANAAVGTANLTATVTAAPVITRILDVRLEQDYTYTRDVAITNLDLAGVRGSTITYALAPLPDGLSFDAGERELSGTPTSVGTTMLTYTATNTSGAISRTFMVTVTDAPVFSTAQEDRFYSVGEAILLDLPAASIRPLPEGSSGPRVTYTLAALPAGAPLPAGLIFDPANRILRGRPTVPATTELVYTAEAAADGVDTLTFSITVAGPVLISTVADMSFTVGTASSTVITLPVASIGDGSRAYSLRDSTGADVDATDNAVPGLVFDTATRVLSGAPTVVGTTELTYTATTVYGGTATQTFRVVVAGTAFAGTVADQFYPVGVRISVPERLLPTALASGTLTYSLTDSTGADVDATGNAVPGLLFTAATRVLSGTPTATGTTLLTYGVTGAVTGTVTPLTFRVVVTGGPTFAVDTIPDQVYDLDAEIPLTVLSGASGGFGTLTYALTDAGQPTPAVVDADGNAVSQVPGLRFDAATRTLFGTMGAATVLTYSVTDAGGNTASLVFALLRLQVSEGFVDAVADQTYTTGQPITLTLPEARLDVEDEDASVTYRLVGPNGADTPDTGRPAATDTEIGLVFDRTTRVLSGIPLPPVSGASEEVDLLTYTATDDDGNVVGFVNFRITVVTAPVFLDTDFLTLFPASYASGQLISPVEFPEATGYGTLSYRLSPVPHGLIFDPATRTLSGAPLESDEVHLVRYSACDANGVCLGSEEFMITIVPMLYFDDRVEDPTYARRAPISNTLTLPNARPTGITTDLPDGTVYEYDVYPLPGGLILGSNTLLGAPTTTGTTVVTYTATHPDTLATVSLTFTVTVVAGPVFSSQVENQGFIRDQAITVTLPVADYGGTGTLTYSLTGLRRRGCRRYRR